MMSGLLKNILTKSNPHPKKPNPFPSFLLHNHFCTQQPPTENSVDPFLQSLNPNAEGGFVYAKLFQIGKYTTKNDVIHLLEGSHLSPHDIRVSYAPNFKPEGMALQFCNRSAFDNAIKANSRKGRLCRLELADRRLWDSVEYYDGKTADYVCEDQFQEVEDVRLVLLQGLPRNALPEDIERFLCGCDFNSSSLHIFLRQSFPDPVRMALVQFPSEIEAMNAVIVKNRSFCLNNQILMRVLQLCVSLNPITEAISGRLFL
ncbi:hypothetical protein IFM89_006794 [Coptis chinensis]|uniref:Uncharacterized protein n=1 Tax=Coptis chinensis TaxID=261450 RepID=A0A835I687_9MAGN|nr:hypothetical protein IFM89_006794 [Coptis chinensis]